MKRLALIGPPATLVKLFSNLGITVIVKQFVKKGENLWCTASPLANWNGQGLGSTTAQTNLGRNDVGFPQGHVLDEQTHHPLAIPIRGSFVTPDPWKVLN